jgi:hypothetical protein
LIPKSASLRGRKSSRPVVPNPHPWSKRLLEAEGALFADAERENLGGSIPAIDQQPDVIEEGIDGRRIGEVIATAYAHLSVDDSDRERSIHAVGRCGPRNTPVIADRQQPGARERRRGRIGRVLPDADRPLRAS